MSTTPVAISTLAVFGPGRYVCPKCDGGSDQEASMSLRFDVIGGVHWRCFRALCGYTGGPRGAPSMFAGPRREPRYYTRPIMPLTQEHVRLIWRRFGLNGAELDGYSPSDDRFILGVHGARGYNRRGCIAYSFSQGPKSLTYNERPDEPFIHYAGYPAGDLVIVEDWFSAEKVATTREATGVAIMGTHLRQEDITEISGEATRRGAKTWLAFDKDAYPKQLKYLHHFREQFPYGLYAWHLEQDLKYETTERIREALNGATNFGTDNSKRNAEGQKSI